jgi:hypothetical protein
MKKYRLAFAIVILALAGLLVKVIGQQAGGKEEIDARAKRDMAFAAAYRTEPGGTPEENLWEVLVLMGVGDTQPASWNGSLNVSSGEIQDVEGYRFELPDRVLPQGGWHMKTAVTRVLLGSPLAGHGPAAAENRLLPKGLLVRGSGTSATSVSVTTEHGNLSFAPMNLPFGGAAKYLGGRIEVRRIPPATDLSGTPLRQHDSPSIAAGDDGTLWVTWSSFHDRQEELNFRRYKDGKWTRLIPVGRAAADLWRPQVATDENNRPWLIWSEQTKGNWDIYAMPWGDNEWGRLYRLTQHPMPDIEPHVARSPDGVIYVVWMSLAGQSSQIRLKYLKNGKWSETVSVTSSARNDWEPAVAAGRDGKAWIAWDRYNTSYDVYCRSYSPSSGLSPETKVAGTERFEAHVSITVDAQGQPWVAWETGAVNWGKDLGAALGDRSPGNPLGGPRRIDVAMLDNSVWKAPAAVTFQDTLASGSTEEGVPLLFTDSKGSIWMAFKRRYSRSAFRPSVYWESFLTRLDGDHWTEPIALPNSWTRRSARMSLAATNERLWAFWPNENRNYAFASRPLLNRVVAGSVILPGAGQPPRLTEYTPEPASARPGHPHETRDVAAIRAHRVQMGSETLRIVRGDLHRHTELSQDVGGLDDGTLPEFYRYMIDAANMDFGASTDHQAGGTDYWNFITLKMTDMYDFPQRYTSLYAYERNLGNPHGHRNIIHIQRNYPIVPFFQRIDPRFMLPDSPDGELLTFNSMSFGSGIENDTKLLYEDLRKSGGIAIPHTSATDSMGTDWRDNDPKLDPVVEIYQGARQSAEAKNVPRGARDGEESKALGGFQEPGLVWNAWKKGYRIGVIASSDHFSTHISYAMVYTPTKSRRAIFDSIRKRHTYGATDNIILEFWLGDHFMGDDFTVSAPQKMRVKAIGTGPIETVHVIRDAKYIYKVTPGTQNAEFEYMDNDAGAGQHWYYVRVEQKNGELAWSSPIWIRYR